jgi:chromosome segregation ATPase
MEPVFDAAGFSFGSAHNSAASSVEYQRSRLQMLSTFLAQLTVAYHEQAQWLWRESTRVGKQWQALEARIRELEVDREKAWAEAQRLATVWQRQNRYIHQQNQRIAELEAQLRSGR